ncbi:hypothetical protein N5J77_00670 [Sphingobium yanoikuyae]|jgi:hypothetical protein|uniref:Uncharacterized protein n=1 Tax=Sphingobium yanoikuyae TaxID=13690 RepID=A0AA42WPW1_SPHYA|nr:MULTISPECIES: hypothetical protein [Sphingobium]MBV2150302.1 hypothetical protein [Sphingobium sp. AS12]MDH2129620.1 hypothetical protein [Sphingobium yanoikuyae]MDH2149714.1 hypothetical protein [Sphingobium yanoikuyae]MDH2165461.1 hypothetical protein [Sphingobium yanoikuyae]QWT14238.1 hypothetical protein GTV57_16725 [Sphingobium xenophagum]|tara:strand:+ start:6042 stop:7058 length:1017 start_codon:yes stop_codon:yes gene_type:complete
MTTQTNNGFYGRQIATKAAPFVIIILAGMAVRTPLAASYPFVALLLFLWIVSDTLMLALVARSSGKPEWRAVLGVLAGASLTVWLGLPSSMRGLLFETPILALMMVVFVLSHIAGATARAGRVLSRPTSDRREQWLSAVSEIFPPALVRLAVAELTVIHMACFRWGGPADVPTSARAFACHKHLTPICATLLILSAIEIGVYHLLVGHWSRIASIVMFILSDVGFVYLVGLIKSFRFRPVLLTPEGVRVRAGFLIDQLVPFEAIVAVESGFTGEEVRDTVTLNAALLAWPNIMLRLDRSLPRRSFLKKRVAFSRVAFRLDDPEPFIRLLVWRLGQRGS